MAAPRWSFALVLGLLGCDGVFGLEGRVPIDAAAAKVTAIDAPSALGFGEAATIIASVEGGLPGTSVMCTFSAIRGAFSGSEVVVQLDPAGAGTASAEYSAPTTAGDDTVRATVDGSTLATTLAVHPLVVLGQDSELGSGNSTFNPGALFGTRVVVPSPTSLRKLGVWSTAVSAGGHIRIGVYTDGRALVAETGAVTLAGGRDTFPLTTLQTLQPGPHWIVAETDRLITVFGMPTVDGEGFLSSSPVTFTDPMPAILPVGSPLQIRFSLFLVGIDN